MPGQNGLETAREIRLLNSSSKIIFLTSSDEFAVESYEVSAYHYLLKPISKDRFFSVMDKLIKEHENYFKKCYA